MSQLSRRRDFNESYATRVFANSEKDRRMMLTGALIKAAGSQL